MTYIASTRFSNETWEEHEKYMIKKNFDGCMYSNRQMIQDRIPLHILIFVIEMNNSTNKIQGIGLIRNSICSDKYFKVYENGEYNINTYKGKYRLSREQLTQINPKIVQCLDHVLFKGKTHLKRLAGITIVPDKLLYHEKCVGIDMKKEIKDAFVNTFMKKKESISELEMEKRMELEERMVEERMEERELELELDER